MSARVKVTRMVAGDWPDVARIFEQGIATGNATFERQVPSWEQWSAARLPEPRLVARDASGVLGWAALSPVSERHVYRGVGSVSIYVDLAYAGRGVGTALLAELIQTAEQAGFWTLQAGIFPENAASIALHEGLGFRVVGTHERIGQMPDGCWRDVVLYERRSEALGSG
jgi:phosphinothricin acetyltransferase